MDKIRAVISGGEKPPVDTDNDHNTDFEADRKMPDLDIVVSKSQEFDPVTSHLVNDIMEDEYAAVHVEDDSPYPEVRAAVPSTDDPTLPQNTIRAWVIGLILTTVGCGMNMLFSFHSPSFAITTFVTSILACQLGTFGHGLFLTGRFLVLR